MFSSFVIGSTILLNFHSSSFFNLTNTNMKTVRALSVVAFLSLIMIACQKTNIQQTELERQRTSMTLTGIENTVPGEPCADGPYVITLVRKQLITEGPLAGKWEWIWSVVNPNPGNGTNGTVQDLSHWGITLPECVTLANIHLAKAFRMDGDNQFYEVFTPKYEADKSFDANGVCPGTEANPVMLKFDYGTVGSYPTYYALVIDKDLSVDPSGTAYYKSGRVTGSCEICFPGIGCEEPCKEGCSFSQGYYFAKPNFVWPSSVTIGGYVYTQAQGKAIWDTPNRGGIADAKKAFLQVAAIKLSGASVGKCATVWADVKIIEDWLKSLNTKLTPANIRNFSNPAAAQAAGKIGEWIDKNHCGE